MSDCCGCKQDQSVKLIEYTIISIKRCEERILARDQILDTGDLGDEGIATWVVADYVQKHGSIPEEERRNLRVYHRVLETWNRQEKDCCGDQQVDALKDINQTLRDLAKNWGGQGGAQPAHA